MPPSSKWSLSIRLSHQNLVHFSVLPRGCHMPCPPHSPWFYLPNGNWGQVQIMKLPTLQLPPFHCYFIPLRSKYSPKHLCQTPSAYALPLMWDQVSHPHKTTGRIMILYILTFTFLDSSQEDKRLWTEW
jgi:hypothetical protein